MYVSRSNFAALLSSFSISGSMSIEPLLAVSRSSATRVSSSAIGFSKSR